MLKRFYMILAICLVIPGLMFTASCATKNKANSEAVATEAFSPQEESEAKISADESEKSLESPCSEMSEKPVFSSLLKPRHVTPETFEITQADTKDFPIMSMTFRLFGKERKPICGLSKGNVLLEYDHVPIDNPSWGPEVATPLNGYLAEVPAARTGLLSLKTVKPDPGECLGRLIVLFRVRSDESGVFRLLSPETKALVSTWTKGFPQGGKIRLADISTVSDIENAFWLTPWLGKSEAVNATLKNFDEVRLPEDFATPEENLNKSVLQAIQELKSQPCDGPRWLVVVAEDSRELETSLDAKVAEALSSSSVTLVVNALHVQEFPGGSHDLSIAAEYSGGRVILGNDSASLESLRNQFCSETATSSDNRYRVKWFDANFGNEPTTRKYRFAFKHDVTTFHNTVSITPDPTILSQWRQREGSAALRIVENGTETEFHGVVNALFERYPMDELQNILKSIHARAMRWACSRDINTGMNVLKRLERLYENSSFWRKKFSKDFESIGDYVLKQGRPRKAISYYKKSLAYKETQTAYEKLLKCQLDILDFKAAQRSVEWVYLQGDLSGRSDQFIQNMAFAYGAGMKFARAEKLIRRSIINVDKGDPVWSYPILTMKGFWFGGAAQIIALAMPNIDDAKAFADLTQEFGTFQDVQCIGFTTMQGEIKYASDDSFRGKRMADLYPFLRELSLSQVNQPVFLNSLRGKHLIGLILIPARGPNTQGLVAFCFDEQLELPERHSLIAVANNSADNTAWDNLRSKIAYRCGSAMTKTMGRIFQTITLPGSNWMDQVIDFYRAFPAEIVAYTIISGRKTSNSPIEVLFVAPADGLPAEIIEDDKANENPYFMYVERSWNGKMIHEFTSAVYSNNQWLGTQRIGYFQ